MFKEEEHPRDEDGKFTFKNGGSESNRVKSPAEILYSNTLKQKEIKEKEMQYKNKLLNILKDKASPADVLYPDTDILERKIKELGLTDSENHPNNSIGNWQKPVEYQRISSPYGWRIHPIQKIKKFHTGVDLSIPQGTQVKTPMDGTVEFAGEQGGYVYVVIINHGTINGKNIKTKYAHLSKFNVKKGDIVKANSSLGLSGGKKGAPGAGTSTGPHLHFEVLENNMPVDPKKYIKY